jgi:hypothetical protein
MANSKHTAAEASRDPQAWYLLGVAALQSGTLEGARPGLPPHRRAGAGVGARALGGGGARGGGGPVGCGAHPAPGAGAEPNRADLRDALVTLLIRGWPGARPPWPRWPPRWRWSPTTSRSGCWRHRLRSARPVGPRHRRAGLHHRAATPATPRPTAAWGRSWPRMGDLGWVDPVAGGRWWPRPGAADHEALTTLGRQLSLAGEHAEALRILYDVAATHPRWPRPRPTWAWPCWPPAAAPRPYAPFSRVSGA